MKLDMGRAWNDAVAMLNANKDVVGIVAAVFLFLPSLAFSVLAPSTEIEQVAASNPDALPNALSAYFASHWWLLAIYVIGTFVGTLALFCLLGKSTRPTVGEAISNAFRALGPYILASLIVGLGVALTIALIALIAGFAGSIVAVALGIVAAAAFVVVSVRIALVGPVMMIENTLNPIAAITRSWNLVKGNTRWVFLFILLLGIAIIVLSMILGLVVGIVAAIASGAVALWIEAALGGAVGAAMSVVMLAAYTAIYRQLSGSLSQGDLEAFE